MYKYIRRAILLQTCAQRERTASYLRKMVPSVSQAEPFPRSLLRLGLQKKSRYADAYPRRRGKRNVETDLPCARRAKRFRRPLTRRNNAEQSKHVTRPVRHYTAVSSFMFRCGMGGPSRWFIGVARRRLRGVCRGEVHDGTGLYQYSINMKYK